MSAIIIIKAESVTASLLSSTALASWKHLQLKRQSLPSLTPAWGLKHWHSHVIEILLPERKAERPAILLIHQPPLSRRRLCSGEAGHWCEGFLSLSPQLTRTAETFTSREANWSDPEATAFTQSPVYKADIALGEGTQGRHPPLQRDSTHKTYTDLCINVHNIINHNGCRCLVAKSCPTCLHPMDCM